MGDCGSYYYDFKYGRKLYKLTNEFEAYYLSRGVGIFKAREIATRKAKAALKNK